MAGKVVTFEGFPSLLSSLGSAGYEVIGPTVGEEAIVYDVVESIEDLPIGWTDNQEAGKYSLSRRNDDAVFGYVVGPRTWKHFLFPPQVTLFTISPSDDGLVFTSTPQESKQRAFLGIRPCELAAIEIQDRVFLENGYSDPTYVTARAGMFTVAVNCAVAGGTCFCTSMGTGPRADDGFDLVLTEIVTDDVHEFIFEVGSEAGAAVLESVDGRPFEEADRFRVDAVVQATAGNMGRQLQTDGVYELLTNNLEHEHWFDIASRCLSCANCTLVCPTCFCSTVEDISDLKGTASRQRRWDSCFTSEFTNLHQHPVRSTTAAKYRQWMTHKLAYWHDQFDSSGCVGCGRCITWCPAGIDITQEVARLRDKTEVVAT